MANKFQKVVFIVVFTVLVVLIQKSDAIHLPNRCDSVCSNSNLACSSNVNCVLDSCSDTGTCYQFCLNCKGILAPPILFFFFVLVRIKFFFTIKWLIYVFSCDKRCDHMLCIGLHVWLRHWCRHVEQFVVPFLQNDTDYLFSSHYYSIIFLEI